MKRWSALAALVLAVSLPRCLWPLPAVAAAPETEPALVVMIAVDQLRRDRLDPTLPGGLGRLAREGRVFSEALLDHGMTETCPGHATMLTGRHPGAAGLPGNRFIDLEAGERAYCVADDPQRAAVIGTSGDEPIGRSPRNLRVTTLGDWMKRERPATRVFSLSGKDRAAIALGGMHADAAYWLQPEGDVGFTSSRHYMAELPDWVARFNRELFSRLPETWTHEFTPPEPVRPDEYAFEADRFARRTPHTLRDTEDGEVSAEALLMSPFADLATLDLAAELVRRERLGRGDGPDLLAISLSATDTVGHLYGPWSHESHDALRRLDRGLGELLDGLERDLGRGRILVALTADHGVLPIPEWLSESGTSECPEEGGRLGMTSLGLGLYWQLHRSFTWILTPPKDWLIFAGSQIAVNRDTAREQGVAVDDVLAETERYLETLPSVRQVWTRDELASGNGDSEVARLYRNSLDPERSGDLIVQLQPTCLITPFDSGTTHGSPYAYDRAVPIALFGTGIEPGVSSRPAATIDIAPTLAELLGIEPGVELDGKSLLRGDD